MVGLTRNGESVEVDFDSGKIGNFTTLDLRIFRDTIEELDGSHRMEGEVVFSRTSAHPVRFITVRGSAINDRIRKFKDSTRARLRLEALVLFSLSPKALLEAAMQSNGQRLEVQKPIQLIVYGVPEEE